MKRSRYAHQVTACSLYHLLTEAYTESLASDFEEFSSEKGHVPQFNFWFITLSLELLLMLKQFKASIGNAANEHKENEVTHHEEGETFQKQFRSDVEKLTMTIKEYGNPFSEDSKDYLIVLHTGSLKKGVPVDNVMKIAEVGEKAYEVFIKERFIERKKPISKTISMNNLRIFDNETTHGKKEQQIKCLKNDVSLFSRLFIACQNRDGDLDDFFRYYNQEFPHASISQYNDLRSGNKADLLKYL